MNQDLLIRHCEIRRSFYASSLTKLEDPPVYIKKLEDPPICLEKI